MSPAGPESTILPADAVEVARVLGPWGVRGDLRIMPYSASPEALFSCRQWHLQGADKPGPVRFSGTALLHVQHLRRQGDAIVASMQEIANRDEAERLQGARIFISRASFPPLAEGEYYWVDLIGLAVTNRQGLALGRVAELMSTGPQQVLVVREEGMPSVVDRQPGEHLIPFVDAYVDTVDLPAGQITVDWQSDY